MRIGFAGTPEVAAQVLERLVQAKVNIDLVITKPDRPSGRNRVIKKSEVCVMAEKFNIPTIKPEEFSKEIIDLINSYNLDLVIVVAYGKILPSSVISLPKLGWYNLHFSLLPKYRGAAPVQAALLAGDNQTGVTLFRIDQGLDTGPILGSTECTIEDIDDANSLFEKLIILGSDLILDGIGKLDNPNFSLVKQTESGVSYSRKLSKMDSLIAWQNTMDVVANQIRACAAGPIAFGLIENQRVKIHNVRKSHLNLLNPGELSRQGKSIYVGTSSGDLELITVQPEGKPKMSASSWFNGLRTKNLRFKA